MRIFIAIYCTFFFFMRTASKIARDKRFYEFLSAETSRENCIKHFIFNGRLKLIHTWLLIYLQFFHIAYTNSHCFDHKLIVWTRAWMKFEIIDSHQSHSAVSHKYRARSSITVFNFSFSFTPSTWMLNAHWRLTMHSFPKIVWRFSLHYSWNECRWWKAIS